MRAGEGELRLRAAGLFLRIPGSRGSPTKSAETVEHVLQILLKPWNVLKFRSNRGTRPTKSVKTVEQLAKARASARAIHSTWTLLPSSRSDLRKRANPIKNAKTAEH